MLRRAESELDASTVYFFANYLPETPDEYLEYWQGSPKFLPFRPLKQLIAGVALSQLAREGKPIRLQYAHSISVSTYVRNRLKGGGLIGEDAVVVPIGIDLDRFDRKGTRAGDAPPVKGLVAGRFVPEKGIHTLLHGLGRLQSSGAVNGFKMTLIGDGPARYLRQLDEIITESKLGSVVELKAAVSHEQFPQVLADHDMLILPSEWDEPLATVLLEAMACGLLVLGTPTGGSPEVLTHMKTGLVFSSGEPDDLAAKLGLALANPELSASLAARGREYVREKFSLQSSIVRIEEQLERVVTAANGWQ